MNHALLRLAALLTLLPLAASPAFADHHEAEAADEWTGFRGLGTEPFWSLDIGADEMVFEHMGVLESRAPRTEPGTITGRAIFMSRSASGRDFIVMIEDDICSDGMSDVPFPKTVNIFLEGVHYYGCGGERQDVLIGDWVITATGPYYTSQDDGLTISFDDEGRVAGNGGCNRYTGGYALSDTLDIGPVASTRRACADREASDREHMLLTLLASVTGFDVGPNDELLLLSDDGPVIEAVRPRPAHD
ncbi:META domain-containing protein [Parasphingopyxis marina]|uniref:META domain-containing protein n=1 Tax=Parasphingopyxis marina TaxID=2761622 RepID=A0A842HXR2_9SPHN|nr:META domain-containing protein [Parasphingopyxis marina]MBC2777109.1 META domain-containing protein [Parasphingopyxis marina]